MSEKSVFCDLKGLKVKNSLKTIDTIFKGVAETFLMQFSELKNSY